MRIFNKFIWSKTEPKNKNDIWFDGSVFNLYRNDTWEAFTLPVDAAEKVAEVIKDALNVFQSKLIEGKGINIKDSVISTTTLFNIVNNLPLEGKEDTIYLVLNSEQDTNRFKEYVWINNTWESLGEFKADVDLSNYVTKQLFNSTLAKKADKSDIPTKMSQLEQDIEIGSDYDDTEIRQEIALRNVGAEDTDESVEEPSIPSNGMSTPSGDPMHYMFEAAGATYNATDADIPMVGVYGDSYVHKAKHWHLNELGDITNEEMREIYLFANMDNSVKNCAQLMQGITTRTNIATWCGVWNNKIKEGQLFGYASKLVTALLRNADTHYTDSNISYMFLSCKGLEKVFPTLDVTSTTSFNGVFDYSPNLREVRIKNAKVPIKFVSSPLISKASILYLIQNSAATSAMVITLHADAYARLAEDADIVAALADKPNVSLASA